MSATFVRQQLIAPHGAAALDRRHAGLAAAETVRQRAQHHRRRCSAPSILAALVWPAIRFLLIDAVWDGSSRVDCLAETVGRPVGACWPFIAAKFAQFMYGFYPADQVWRVNLTYAVGVVLLVPLLIPRVPYKTLNAILFFGVFPVVGVLPAGRRRVRPASMWRRGCGAACW